MKKFLIIGNVNAVTYKEIFQLIKENKIRLGKQSNMLFTNTNNELKHIPSCWYTNVNVTHSFKDLKLDKKYDADKYNHLLNYDCINVDRVKDIPYDYDGVIAAPLTVMFYNPQQFDIIGCVDANVLPDGWSGMTKEFVDLYYSQGGTGQYQVNKRLACYITKDGKTKIPYKRILIKLKNNKDEES